MQREEPFTPVTVARVLRPWGRRGEVAAEILTDFPQRLARRGLVWLFDGRQPPRAIKVLSCRIHLGQMVFHFDGVKSISDAERLRGVEVQLPMAERAPLGAGRHYIDELVGAMVWETGASEPLGSVSGVVRISEGKDAPEAWILEISTPRGQLLIPLAADICTSINPPARRIEVILPEGLRELNPE